MKEKFHFQSLVTILYKATPVKEGFDISSPAMIVGVLFFLTLGISVLEFKRMRRMILVRFLHIYCFWDRRINSWISLLYFTSGGDWEWNLNLIWALPTHFIFAFLLLAKPLREKLSRYMKFTTIILCLFLINMVILPQTFHWLVVPLSLILLLRTGGIAFFYQLPALFKNAGKGWRMV